MSYTQQDVDRAIDVLDGVIEIAENEQLMQGRYVSSFITRPDLTGALCGGHSACFIGSMYIAAGVKPNRLRREAACELVGVYEEERHDFMLDKPGLRLAYEAANKAAKRYAEQHQFRLVSGDEDEDEWDEDEQFTSAAEALFEHGLKKLDPIATRDHVIQVCRNAQHAIKRQHGVYLEESTEVHA